MQTTSLLWHDYETWGIDPRNDFPSQFAAIRTDLDLNIIEEPVMLYARPPSDRLPHPMASLVTRQTPQDILEHSPLSDVDFITQINAMMSQSNTCTIGYNNLRFDDEVTRFALYRNLLDPYAREWQNGCSRWDILDVLRLARSLRPEGITWPVNDEGRPSMRLEDLTRANDIDHGDAHDALADVYATIAMAKLLKEAQPKLYDYAFSHRNKKTIAPLLQPSKPQMVLHVSGMYPTEKGNMAIVMPIAQDPSNSNAIAVFDLSEDPAVLNTTDIEHLNYLLFSKTDDLQEGEKRLPIKTVHINKCPIIAPIKTLSESACQQYNIDLEQCAAHKEQLKAIPNLENTIQKVLSLKKFPPSNNPDTALYEGFINSKDRNICNQILQTTPNELDLSQYAFQDTRLPTVALRFKARNYPHFLTFEEKTDWEAYCHQQIHETGALTLAQFEAEITRLQNDEHLKQDDLDILKKLSQWPTQILV